MMINRKHTLLRRSSRGFTLIEVLVALAVAMTFLAALYTSFIQAIKVGDQTQGRLEGMRNVRAATMTMCDEFSLITTFSSSFLVSQDENAGYGDLKDNDGDGRIDEEIFDGRDDDGDWNAANDDQHARFGASNIYERFHYSNDLPFSALYPGPADDLGDLNVDEDTLFGRDVITFRVQPADPASDILFRTITYRIGSYDNQDFVLLRETRTEFQPGLGLVPRSSLDPLAFNCVGLDFLFWDPNGNPDPGRPRPERPYWKTSWNSLDVGSFNPPRLPLPASIFFMVTGYADAAPIQEYKPQPLLGQGLKQIDTFRMPMILNIEEIIDSVDYPRANI